MAVLAGPAPDRSGAGLVTARVEQLYVYPVKGMTPQAVNEVDLAPGTGFPYDRVIALARPGGAYIPGMRCGIDKSEFFALVSEARLAGLTTHFDPRTGRFTTDVRGHRVLDVDLDTDEGNAALRTFYARVLDLPPGVEPVIARDEGRQFTDTAHNSDRQMALVSLINLATVRDFSSRTEQDVHPLRFRGNIYVDGLAPWEELTLLGREFQLGEVKLRGVKPTGRCAATEVAPGTGRRDIPVPRLLTTTYGHQFMGVYAEVVSGGTLAGGDSMTVGELVG